MHQTCAIPYIKIYVNNKIENHEQYINQVHHVPKCAKKISSMECINHMPLSICQHVHLPICQPCASTNIPTMCIYQYANHVHLSICQPRVISLMICLHHEPSTITMYQTSTNCCDNQVIPILYYYQVYAIYECTKHHHASIPQNDESHIFMPNPPQNMCQSKY
jgi:hypothetical protein